MRRRYNEVEIVLKRARLCAREQKGFGGEWGRYIYLAGVLEEPGMWADLLYFSLSTTVQ